MRLVAASVVALLTAGFHPPLAAADPLAGVDDLVNAGLKSHGVPGVGVAIVKDGKVILARGYGLRAAGKPEPVSEKSLFAIGSVSKSFTAAALALLVDEKKVTWDDPLGKHLKGFHLPDNYQTQEVTLRDALCHRVGIARNELIWYGSPFDRKEVLAKLKDVKPGAKFRTSFVYNNMLYLAAGQTIPEVAAGKSWDDFVAERLFKSLGMDTANTSITKLPKDGDVATPHEKVKGKATAVPWKNADNIGPAGSINASAADMAEYVKFQLSEGKGKEKRLVKRDTFKEMHTPQTLMPAPGITLNPDSHLHAYGFGWMLADFRGKRLVEHGGNIDGMTAQVGMLPDDKIGVVVLANLGGSLLPQALMFDLFDRLLGETDAGRVQSSSVLMGVSQLGTAQLVEPAEGDRVKGTKPSREPAKYAGKYQDNLHAPFVVKRDGEKLSAEFNGWAFDLEHWHFDTFKAKDRRGVLPGILLGFPLGTDGKVSEVRLKLFGQEELKFPRKE